MESSIDAHTINFSDTINKQPLLKMAVYQSRNLIQFEKFKQLRTSNWRKLLHLLENFAKIRSKDPIEGQLWYDVIVDQST